MKNKIISWIESVVFLVLAYYGTIEINDGVYRILCLYLGLGVLSSFVKLFAVSHPEEFKEDDYKMLCGITKWKRWKNLTIDFVLMFLFAYTGNIVLAICTAWGFIIELGVCQNAAEKIKKGCKFKEEEK